ncbi:uncharacterized protein LOC123911353 [Trifolium pratense]|uniref:uncharacterized protein LOC123911353 n=1 Tax=Trifolium pratense TaxID=57577 RepID=UPI001E694DB2|nr:uncharacterized protein LOC123911353 [Trifolium pratense]
MDDPSAPSLSEKDTQPTKKRGRRGTRMIELTLSNVKKPIDFDQKTKLPLGANRKKFKSHVGSVARKTVSILVDEWEHVDENVKKQIWDDIMLTWDIRDTDIGKLKDKWISYAGERWRAFKTSLTTRYLNDGVMSDKSPLETYSFLDEETWQEFIKTREDRSFLEKRKRGQMVQACNKYPHIMSRGGYELIEEKMMQEKIKQRQESAGESLPTPPSPPKRHEKWIVGRTKPSGEYTSKETQVVADKITSLVQKTAEGTFVPQGRNDILTEAIGRPEHPGRVRAAGRGVGIRQYFGPQSRSAASTSLVLNSTQVEAIKIELTKEIREQLMRDISSMPVFSQQYPNFPTCSPDILASTNGSCSAVRHIPVDEDEEDIPDECELYVDNKHHMAYANVYNLGPTIHNQLLDNDMARVAITKVLDPNVPVPRPTDEVTKVGEALNNFIQWPKRLLRLVANKDDEGKKKDVLPSKRSEPDNTCAEKLMLKIMSRKDDVKFKLEGDAFFSLPTRDIMELCLKTQDLRVSILRIWVVYMKHLCTRLDKSNMYGFIDPNFIQPQTDRAGSQSYITEKLVENEKYCFFVPYLHNHHWQLLIIEPKTQNVIFLCSKGLRPDKNIVLIVDSAINGYNMLKGSRKQRKPTWKTTLTCQRQSFNHESGYYVLIHMLNIVSAGIVNSWNQVFGDSTPFHEDEVSNVQERLANSILEFV